MGEDKAIDAVNHLRNDLIPGAFGDSSATVLVTGDTAFNTDFRDSIIFRTPFVLAFVMGLAFLIMLVAFRSLVIAAKAIVLNLLSVGAAYGLLVLVSRGAGFSRNRSVSRPPASSSPGSRSFSSPSSSASRWTTTCSSWVASRRATNAD